MARPKTNGTTIFIRLSPSEKEKLAKKLIATGFTFVRKGEVEAAFSEFGKVLADMPLEFFQKNFSKSIDTLE